MIVDASALVAIVRGESNQQRCVAALIDSAEPLISAANLLEAAIVVDGARDPAASRYFDQTRARLGIAIAPVTAAHVEIARQAYREFGQGSGHPARLNFGDCFAYALASERGEPLLYLGDDFAHTDIESALGE